MKVLLICASAGNVENLRTTQTYLKALLSDKIIGDVRPTEPNGDIEYFIVNPEEYEGGWLSRDHYFKGEFGNPSQMDLHQDIKDNGPYDIVAFNECSIYSSYSIASQDNPFRNMQYAREQVRQLLQPTKGLLVFYPCDVHDILYGGDAENRNSKYQLNTALPKYFSLVTHIKVKIELRKNDQFIRVYQVRPENDHYGRPTVDPLLKYKCAMCSSDTTFQCASCDMVICQPCFKIHDK